VQASAKKTCFQFAERRQSFAKIAFLNDTSKSMRLDFRFRRVSVCQRAIRLREAFIFYPLPTEDSLWFLHIGKGQTFQEMTFAMRGNAKPFGKRLSPCAEMPNLSGNDFRHARKCQTKGFNTSTRRITIFSEGALNNRPTLHLVCNVGRKTIEQNSLLIVLD